MSFDKRLHFVRAEETLRLFRQKIIEKIHFVLTLGCTSS